MSFIRNLFLHQENNGGYQPDEFTKRSFEQKLDDLIEQVEPNRKFARNALTLDVNNVIANGQYGDVIRGKLNGEPCQVHVVSGEFVGSVFDPAVDNVYFFYFPLADDMEPLDQSQFLKDLVMVQKLTVHENVISFYGICQTADWLYLLFEDTPTTLKRTLIESRTPPNVNPHRFSSLSEQRVLVILHEIAVAMEYLSSEQVGLHPLIPLHHRNIYMQCISPIRFCSSCTRPCAHTTSE